MLLRGPVHDLGALRRLPAAATLALVACSAPAPTDAPGCDALPDGPLTATLLQRGYVGSEDLAFDGDGGLALRRGDRLLLVDAALAEREITSLSGQVFGTRFLEGGALVVARPDAGEVARISPDGAVEPLVRGLVAPNAVHVDARGDVWISDFGGDAIYRLRDGALEEIVAGPAADSANGLVYDERRAALFYADYLGGALRRVDMEGELPGAPALVAEIDGNPDGITLDACGHLYVIDNGDGELYRVRLDADGDALGEPELLVEFHACVTNGQLGAGAGFDPQALYVIGVEGDLYAVPLGVGAPAS
ncbi:MAG: hypothetical protein R3A51_21910 [Nannocystaceae bacterium]|nr:SMP-30/gluconolactonase/LRE family protein [Myxococcales bacterium]